MSEVPQTKRNSGSVRKQKDVNPIDSFSKADIFTTQTPKKVAKNHESANKSFRSHKHDVSISSKE
jgi:hypothetical protein